MAGHLADDVEVGDSALPEPIPATNRKMKLHGVSVVHFNGHGKAKKFRTYSDSLEFFTQLGIQTPPPVQ